MSVFVSCPRCGTMVKMNFAFLLPDTCPECQISLVDLGNSLLALSRKTPVNAEEVPSPEEGKLPSW